MKTSDDDDPQRSTGEDVPAWRRTPPPGDGDAPAGSPLGQGWEPWEARRTRLPRRADPETREAREDARLLLMVVQAKFEDGTVPLEHAEALARAAEDARLTSRLQLRAATALAKLRMAAIRGATGSRA